jgi:dipeptidase E
MDEIDHPYDGCYEWFQKQIVDVDVIGVDMPRTFEQFASLDFNDYSAIFIGGGNTYKLLKGLKQIGAFSKSKDYIKNDGVVVGCSAGAVICGKDIDIISPMDPNDVALTDTLGFDVMNGISIFPHYINLKSKLSKEENEERITKFTNHILEFSKEKGNVYAIPEEDTIYINNNSVEVIGPNPYFIAIKGNIETFNK